MKKTFGSLLLILLLTTILPWPAYAAQGLAAGAIIAGVRVTWQKQATELNAALSKMNGLLVAASVGRTKTEVGVPLVQATAELNHALSSFTAAVDEVYSTLSEDGRQVVSEMYGYVDQNLLSLQAAAELASLTEISSQFSYFRNKLNVKIPLPPEDLIRP